VESPVAATASKDYVRDRQQGEQMYPVQPLPDEWWVGATADVRGFDRETG